MSKNACEKIRTLLSAKIYSDCKLRKMRSGRRGVPKTVRPPLYNKEKARGNCGGVKQRKNMFDVRQKI